MTQIVIQLKGLSDSKLLLNEDLVNPLTLITHQFYIFIESFKFEVMTKTMRINRKIF